MIKDKIKVNDNIHFDKDKDLHTYRVKVVKIYDGDTITVDIDVGFGIKLESRIIRLARINAPEVRGERREAGIASRDLLRKMLDGRDVLIQTYKDKKGKYGRYIGEVWVLDPYANKYYNTNDRLVTLGFAKYVDY